MNSATLHTSMGDIVIELFPNHAPKTVANFVELATGAKEWVDPNVGEKVKTNLYDGTIFHRVIPGFMIQGGDPLGSGMGGPGYNFADEFHGELNFDKPYLLQWQMLGLIPMAHNSLLQLRQLHGLTANTQSLVRLKILPAKR